jgi:hypothetical protein
MAVLGTKGPGNGLPNIQFFATTSWSPATTTTAYVYVIGGGGSGAAAGNNSTGVALGGGAGGCAVSLLTMSSSVTYTATIGAGGGNVAGSASGNNNGEAGVNSTFAGSDISTMTGTGGSAGQVDTSGGPTSGASGGTPTGGNIANYVGGSGYGNTQTATKGATGGGGVGLWMNGRAPGTNEQGTSQKLTLGGNLSGWSRGSGNSKNTNPDFVAGYPMPVAMEPFSGMLTTYYTQEWADYDDANNYSLGFNTINTGMQQMFNDATAPFLDGSDEMTDPNGSAFCGGGGVAYNLKYVTAGRGVLGGGGGGAYTTSTTSGNAAYNGIGGHGCVLIFPVSI